MSMTDPRWEELRQAVKRNDTPLIKLLSLELNVTYISDNQRSFKCKSADEHEIACATCKFGKECGASWSGWECMLEQFRFCKPDIPTAAFMWTPHPDKPTSYDSEYNFPLNTDEDASTDDDA